MPIAHVTYNDVELTAEYDVEPGQVESWDCPGSDDELYIDRLRNKEGVDVYDDYEEDDILYIESLIINQLQD